MNLLSPIGPVLLSILSIILLFVAAGGIKVRAADAEKPEFFYYYDNPCVSCDPGGEFEKRVKEVLSDNGADFTCEIRTTYAYSTAGSRSLEEKLEEIGVSEEDVTLPILIAGSEYLCGSSCSDEELYSFLSAAAGKASGGPEGSEEQEGKVTDSANAATSGQDGQESSTEAEATTGTATDAAAEETEGAVSQEASESVTRKITTDDVVIRYFHSASCTSCDHADKELQNLMDRFGEDDSPVRIELQGFLLEEKDDARVLTQLFGIYRVPEESQKVPIVFIGQSWLAGDSITEEALLDAVLAPGAYTMLEADKTGAAEDASEAEDAAGTEDAAQGSGAEGAATAAEVTTETASGKSGAFSILSVVGRGLINGLGACTLSMTLLFYSLLQGNGKKMIFGGLLFLLGRFAACVLLGILIGLLAARIPFSIFHTAAVILNGFLLILCILLAAGNIHDAVVLKKGEPGRVKVQLPAFMRRGSEKLLRRITGLSESRVFPVAAFAIGFIIAIGEFFCTGQIYLASILEWIQESPKAAVPLLYYLVYSLMLIVPGLVLLLLLSGGESILRIQSAAFHSEGYVKLLNAAVLILIAVFALRTILG